MSDERDQYSYTFHVSAQVNLSFPADSFLKAAICPIDYQITVPAPDYETSLDYAEGEAEQFNEWDRANDKGDFNLFYVGDILGIDPADEELMQDQGVLSYKELQERFSGVQISLVGGSTRGAFKDTDDPLVDTAAAPWPCWPKA